MNELGRTNQGTCPVKWTDAPGPVQEAMSVLSAQSRVPGAEAGVVPIKNAWLVTAPELVRDILVDTRFVATRPHRLRDAITPAASFVRDFYDGWPMLTDGEAHSTGRSLAMEAVRASQARLDRRFLGDLLSTLFAQKPQDRVEWVSEIARPYVDQLFWRLVPVHDQAARRVVDEFTTALLNDLAVPRRTLRDAQRLRAVVSRMHSGSDRIALPRAC